MKLIWFIAAPFAAESTQNRAFSDWPPFLVDGSSKKYWKKNNNHIEKYNNLEPAVKLFYETFFTSNPKAHRFATHAQRWLNDVRTDFPRNVHRCDRRSKRGASTVPSKHRRSDNFSLDELTARWTLPTSQGIKKGYEALFYQFARWAREEIYWDCPKLGMRIVSKSIIFNLPFRLNDLPPTLITRDLF